MRAAVVTCSTCGLTEQEHVASSSIIRATPNRWVHRDGDWLCPDCTAATRVADGLVPWAWDNIDGAECPGRSLPKGNDPIFCSECSAPLPLPGHSAHCALNWRRWA